VASRAAAVADVSAATLAGSEHFSGEAREPSRPSPLVGRAFFHPRDEPPMWLDFQALGTIFRPTNKE
jgi:hypothetical protein